MTRVTNSLPPATSQTMPREARPAGP
jgi:hypothetical protein